MICVCGECGYFVDDVYDLFILYGVRVVNCFIRDGWILFRVYRV